MECLVCGSCNNLSKFLSAKRHHPTYWKCKGCGFVFASPQLRIDYENYKYSPISYPEFNVRLKNYRLRYDILRKYFNKKQPAFLDIGAHYGIFLRFLKSKDIDAIGLEPNLDAALYAKRNYNVEILSVSFEEFESQIKFDVITMFNVLEHVVDPIYTIKKIKRMLDKNGLLVLELPNIFTWPSLLSFGYWHQFQREHNWFFSTATISTFLNKQGFMIKNVMFCPKMVTFAKIFDGLMATFKLYKTRENKLKFRETKFYKYLNNKQIKVNINDYLLIIAQKYD